MTTIVLATVTLPARTGNAADDVDNDFVFSMATFTSTDADNIATALASFYNTVQTIPGTDRAVGSFINESISRSSNAVTINMYDITAHLDGSAHGSPTFTRNFTLVASDGPDPLPQEVAFVDTYHSDLTGLPERSGSTRPASRRRGRVYLGPLNTLAGSEGADGVLRPGGPITDTVIAASTTLKSALSAGWRVWSRVAGAVYGPITGGWVDDAFDTMRKRGPDPTAKNVW